MERDDNSQQQFEHEQHQQWLIANPMSQSEYERREKMWYEFFKPKGKQNERKE